MNQSENRTARYAVAGVCSLVLLLLISWLVLREEPTPSTQQPPAKVVAVTPRDHSVAPLFAPDEEVPHEAVTNQVAESAPSNTNGAAIYRQAFAMYDALTKEQKGLIMDWRTNVDADRKSTRLNSSHRCI